jgi:hypothetical protein
MNNIGIFLTPRPDTLSKEVLFIAAIAEDQKAAGEAVLSNILPEAWAGKYVVHLHAAVQIPEPTDHEEREEWKWFEDRQITHLACLESNVGAGPPFVFYDEPITHNSLLVFYSAPLQKYWYMHCRQEAMAMISGIMAMQEALVCPGSHAMN